MNALWPATATATATAARALHSLLWKEENSIC
eukprot:COSAG01_NODE_7864_length_3019_cov_76.927080_2_plen_32_part_00